MNWNKRSIETDPFSFVDLSAEGMRSTACEPFSREPFRAKDHINFQKDLYFQFGTVYFQSEPPIPIIFKHYMTPKMRIHLNAFRRVNLL